ncbi:hypothetical protein ACFFRR_003794 [Megaselia abdita]
MGNNKMFGLQLHSFTIIWGWAGAVVSSFLVVIGIIALIDSEIIVEKLRFGNISFAEKHLTLTSIGLICGVLAENHKFFLPWIFNEVLDCIVHIFATIVLASAIPILLYEFIFLGIIFFVSKLPST